MQRLRRVLALMLHALVLAIAFPAAAEPSTHIRPELLAERTQVAPGGTVRLALRMVPEPGWHGYWLNPGDAGLGITFIPQNTAKELRFGTLQYPVPQVLVVSGLMNHVYESEYAVLLPVTVDPAADPALYPITLQLNWLACTDKICVPESATVSLKSGLTVAKDPASAARSDGRFDAWQAALPAPLGSKASFAVVGNMLRLSIPLPSSVVLDQPHLFVASEGQVKYAAAQRFFRDGDRLVVELERADNARAVETLQAVLRLGKGADGLLIEAAPGKVSAGGKLLDDGPPLVWLLLSALLGGLLLNVMPCVFPILSLKALSLVRAGESEAQARAEGLAYTAGVVLACLALGALLLALRAGGEQIGWAFQLQEPLVVAGLLLLAVTITANLAGLFEFAVPGFASEGSPRHGILGAFATGLLAAFVATPCTGPFMAAAMGAALLLPVGPALLLFAALGLGLALPFLLLAYVPALRRRLPKPGAWMSRFKLVMAVPMGLTAVALLWLASRVAGGGFALSSALLAFILIALLIVAGRRQRHGLAAGTPVWAGLGALTLAFALGMPSMVREGSAAVAGILNAKPFSEAALAKARASGKPVFAYFTADWCLTCKVNEAAAIEREETRKAFEKAGVVVLRGDWTRRDPAITRYLTAQGAAGVPLYMWYPAGGGAGQQLPQVLTPAMLADLTTKTRTD